METLEEIRTAEYLFRASPETVYEWLKAWPQRTAESPRFMFGNDIPEMVESKLLARNDEVIDLALSAWGTRLETISGVYQRRCSRQAVDDWPPSPSTFAYSILASTLANVNFDLRPWEHISQLKKQPWEDLEWLIEHGDLDLLEMLHRNISMGGGLLRNCAYKIGVYGRIDSNRWLWCLGFLDGNGGLYRPNSDNDDGPDLVHWDIHKAFINAATVCPKTLNGAEVLGKLLWEMPATASEHAYVADDVLAAAIESWNVELPSDDETGLRLLKYFHEIDALTPSERVQFHLLRHYCLYLKLDPDDPVRVVRLAAYAKNPVNGGKGWGDGYQDQLKGYTGKGLDIESFQRYSERDGPAFMYANSFNEHIWCDKTASEKLDRYDYVKMEQIFRSPEDREEMYQNRKKCVNGKVAKELLDSTDTDEEPTPLESRTIAAVAQVREELGNIQVVLSRKIGNLKTWLICGGGVLIVLLLFRG